ncbi:hypothetical protein ACFX13_038709 [Malus domestica]
MFDLGSLWTATPVPCTVPRDEIKEEAVGWRRRQSGLAVDGDSDLKMILRYDDSLPNFTQRLRYSETE